MQNLHVSGVRSRAVHGLGHDPRAAPRNLRNGRVLQVVQSGATLTGQEEIPQTTSTRLNLEVLNDGRGVPGPDFAALRLVDRLSGQYMLVEKVIGLLLQCLSGGVVCEFHARLLSRKRG